MHNITQKMRKLIYSLALLLLATPAINAQKLSRKEQKQQQKQQVEKLIESGTFTFEAQSAQPSVGRMITLTGTDYTLQLNGDSIDSYLPYYGRAYVAPLGRDEGGIKFKTLMESCKKTYNERKRLYQYDISVVGEYDKYNIMLRVGDTGHANLLINCNNRSSINFSGIIRLDTEE